MRLAYLTTHFPFGHDETFFEPEVRSLARAVERRSVMPVRPRLEQSAFPFAKIAGPHYRMAAKVKNVLLFPKALATAQVLRRIGVDHIHVQWITTSATVAMIAANLLDIPWSCTAHQHDIFFDNLIPEKVKDAAFVRVISRRNAEFLIALAGKGSRLHTHVVHLGVDVPEHYVQRQESGAIRLLCAARFASSKGHRYLIAALALLKERGIAFQCEFAGDGELAGALRAQIAAAGLEREIDLRGVVQHARIVEELNAGRFDLAVLASTERPGEHEGIPVALMEAMAAGVACVTTDTGSNSELIDATCGILVGQRDPKALADAIESLAVAPERRRLLGRNAHDRVTEAFETKRTTAELLLLLGSSWLTTTSV
jgi:glycosyltransferase involved in cell wall biosynthesis